MARRPPKQPDRVGLIDQFHRIGSDVVAAHPDELKGVPGIIDRGFGQGGGAFRDQPGIGTVEQEEPMGGVGPGEGPLRLMRLDGRHRQPQPVTRSAAICPRMMVARLLAARTCASRAALTVAKRWDDRS